MLRRIRKPLADTITLRALDGRTKEAKLMRATRRAMVAHIGGKPDATQAVLIERIVNLTLRVAIMDRKFAKASGEPTDYDSRTYLGWTNTLTRSVLMLGKAAAHEPVPAPIAARPLSLAEHRAARANPPAPTGTQGTAP